MCMRCLQCGEGEAIYLTFLSKQLPERLKYSARLRMEVLKMHAGREIPHVFRLFIALQCSDHRAASICLNRVHIWGPLGCT